MKKFIYLSTCDTCKKLMKELDLSDFELQNIKINPISEEELSQLKKITGNYESLFSKRAQLYKKLNLKNKDLTEEDFKNYILENYTFLKRPILVNDSEILIGSSPSVKKKMIDKFGI